MKLNPTKTLELSKAATPGEWCYDDHIVNKGDTPGMFHIYKTWVDDGPFLSTNETHRAECELVVHNRNTCEHYASWVQRALPILSFSVKILRIFIEEERRNSVDRAILFSQVDDIERLIEEVQG